MGMGGVRLLLIETSTLSQLTNVYSGNMMQINLFLLHQPSAAVGLRRVQMTSSIIFTFNRKSSYSHVMKLRPTRLLIMSCCIIFASEMFNLSLFRVMFCTVHGDAGIFRGESFFGALPLAHPFTV